MSAATADADDKSGIVQAARYLAVAGVAAAFYDHALSFSDEVEYIWTARWSTPKISFLICRYLLPSGLFYHTFLLSNFSPNLSDDFCQHWFVSASILAVGLCPPLHFLVVLWVWVSWGRNRSLVISTLSLFILTELCILCLGIVLIIRLSPEMMYNARYHMCMLTKRGLYPVFLVPLLCFDTVSLVSVLWHSFSRLGQRDHDGTQQTGTLFIFLIFLMTLANFVVSAVAPTCVIFLAACFLLSITTIAMMKLIVNMRKDSSRRRRRGHSQPLSRLPSSSEDGIEH